MPEGEKFHLFPGLPTLDLLIKSWFIINLLHFGNNLQYVFYDSHFPMKEFLIT